MFLYIYFALNIKVVNNLEITVPNNTPVIPSLWISENDIIIFNKASKIVAFFVSLNKHKPLIIMVVALSTINWNKIKQNKNKVKWFTTYLLF